MKNLTIAMAYNDTVRIYAIDSTDIVNKAQQVHNSWPTATAALGRTLTAAAMMNSMNKNDERMLITIDGNGPIGRIYVETDTDGTLKGTVTNPSVYFKYESGPKAGKLNVAMAVGTDGYLTVTKDLQLKEPFVSSVPLQTGEIAEDFTYFFAASEQVPSAVSLGVLVDTDYSVKAAGGFIIQIMPGASDETLDALEKSLSSIASASTLIDQGFTSLDIIKEFTTDFRIVEEHFVEYQCDCSKERFARGIVTLPRNEVEEILEEDGKIEVTCNFCGSTYTYTSDDLE